MSQLITVAVACTFNPQRQLQLNVLLEMTADKNSPQQTADIIILLALSVVRNTQFWVTQSTVTCKHSAMTRFSFAASPTPVNTTSTDICTHMLRSLVVNSYPVFTTVCVWHMWLSIRKPVEVAGCLYTDIMPKYSRRSQLEKVVIDAALSLEATLLKESSQVEWIFNLQFIIQLT